MKLSSIYLWFIFLLAASPIQSQITGTFTADNSYAVYKGNQSAVSAKILPNNNSNGHTNKKASEIFSPTKRTFSVTKGDYLYIIAWSDDSQCQGLLGEFTGTQTIKTGDKGWQVYPTNKNYGNNQAPSISEINSFISTANNSNGWKNPFVGPTNANSKKACRQYSKVKGISNSAKWIWHNTLSTNDPLTVLGRGRNHHEFLIFRFPVKLIGTTSAGTVSGSSPSIKPGPCDCIPKEIYTVDVTSEQFIPHSWSGNAGTFSYKLGFQPTNQNVTMVNAWNSWIQSKFGGQCHVVHQYILYEYTSNTPGVIQTETMLEEFWSSPNYLSGNNGKFTSSLQSNKKYYIKHGVYYGAKKGRKCNLANDCPWQETRFFIGTSTGSSPTLRVMGERGKQLKTKAISKRKM